MKGDDKTQVPVGRVARAGKSVTPKKAARTKKRRTQELPSYAMTVEEAGVMLRISRSSAYAAAKCGEIPAFRIGDRWIVPRRKIEEMLGITPDD
jgi:excisionase family DNA binding protein